MTTVWVMEKGGDEYQDRLIAGVFSSLARAKHIISLDWVNVLDPITGETFWAALGDSGFEYYLYQINMDEVYGD